jgi:FAD dependent oxidoreductase
MALAGVSYTIGRESSAQYGEPGNGIQPGHPTNQLPRGIDPYVIAGDPSSGLLPGVNATVGGAKGDADKRVQAYCYRMCLTNHEPNKIAITKPADYNEKDYELILRAIEAGQKSRFFKFSLLPNHKTDSNNDSGASTDFIGMNYAYPEADYATRDQMAAAHKKWQLGLIWTLQHHPRVPEAIRNEHLKWGLPKDEFVNNDNWAHALYVREARRMVSDYVATQDVIANKKEVTRSIGMGAYMMDSHQVQRYVTENGNVQNEGDIQIHISKGGPYSIDYGTIIPKKSECENLYVTFAVSASHIAFGSIRMEPVFMVLSQSASTAAAIAIDQNLAVQDVPYELLEKKLLADGQRLQVKKATSK